MPPRPAIRPRSPLPPDLQRLRALVTQPLPQGGRLPEDVWQPRHRGMTLLLAFQAAAFVVVAQSSGTALQTVSIAFWVVVASATAIALTPRCPRAVRTSAVAVGLVACSAYLIHLTDGMTAAHLHVFVVLTVIALYQDWVPFLAASGGIALHHVVVGAVAPAALFADPASITAPQRAVGLHLALLAAASVASVLAWRLGEQQRARADLVLDATADGVHGLDADGRITFANAALARLVDARPGDLVGRPHHEALGHVAGATGPCPVCTAIASGRGVPTPGLRLAPAGGREIPVECGATPLWEKGAVTGVVVTYRDLTERERLQRQALHDPLTGLANRSLLRAHLSQALARIDRARHGAALLFCDLDRFKDVNDTLGHAVGDALLVETAERLRGAVRAHDTVARIGGDEFVVLCTDLESSRDVMVIAERLQLALAQPFRVEGVEAAVSASIGVTVFGDPRSQADTLLDEADAAMYRAKERGRDRIEVFDDELRARAGRRRRIEEQLATAIARSELTLVLDPRVRLTDGTIEALEAVVRWEHAELGTVPSAELVAIAEDVGLLEELGHWTLETACRTVAERNEPGGASPSACVPLPRPLLRDTAFADAVAASLDDSCLPAERLCLLVSERALPDDTPATVEGLHALKALGVTLAVEDFGVGWSSLSSLSRLPIDVLKVDRSFVGALDLPGDGRAVLDAALGLARALGLEVVADGVDDPAQAAVLRELGCELAQGALFAGAVPNT